MKETASGILRLIEEGERKQRDWDRHQGALEQLQEQCRECFGVALEELEEVEQSILLEMGKLESQFAQLWEAFQQQEGQRL